MDVVYLDFAKAFDKVPHIRREKMEACGFGGNLLRWIENWLKDRRQRVGIRGAFSEWIGVISAWGAAGVGVRSTPFYNLHQ